MRYSQGATKPRSGSGLNWGHPLTRGLLARYLFNEGGGTQLYDVASGKNHAILTSMDPATDWAGGALDFDGVDDYAVAPIVGIDGAARAGISVRFRTTTSQSAKYIVACPDAVAGPGIAVRLDSTPSISAYFNGASIATLNVNYADGFWHQVVVTCDGTNAFIYYDGVLGASGAFSAAIVATSLEVDIGRRGGAVAAFYTGQVGDVRVYNRTVLASEAAQLNAEPYADQYRPSFWSRFVDRAHAFMEIEAKFQGDAGGWSPVDDVLMGSVGATYGLSGTGPTDLVAPSGHMSFALDNSEDNGAGLIGYYSPNNANCRPGFGQDIAVRLRWNIPGFLPFFKFLGRLVSIDPAPNALGERRTQCSAVDFMDDLAEQKVELPVQVDKRPDQIINLILDSMPRQPGSRALDVGESTFRYALDNSRSEAQPALTELQRVAQSEPGRIYIKGDRVAGGVFTFERRSARLVPVPVQSFDNTGGAFMAFKAPNERGYFYNRIKVTVHPRLVDTVDTTVLYLEKGNPDIEIGSTVTVTGRYTDPANRASRVGGTDMQPITTAITSSSVANPTTITTAVPHGLQTGDTVIIWGHTGSTPAIAGKYTITRTGASTFTIPVNVSVGGTGGTLTGDYEFNTLADGSGTDLTPTVTVTVVFGANSPTFTIVNSSGSLAYRVKLRARGRGLYDYQPYAADVFDAASILARGEALLKFDMPYQHGGQVANTIANNFLHLWNIPQPRNVSLGYVNKDDASLAMALALEPGHAITLTETVSGISKTFFVNQVSLKPITSEIVRFDWLLELALSIPAVMARATSFVASDGTSHAVTLPSGIVAGELLISAFTADGNPTITWPAGWTEFATGNAPANVAKISIVYRWTDGSEGSTVTVTTSASEQSSHVTLRIAGAKNPASQPPEASVAASGSSGSDPNPAALTPIGTGAENYLWLAVFGQDVGNGFGQVKSPEDYIGGQVALTSTATGTATATAERTKFATSEDPGGFSLNSIREWVAFTVAVHPK
jgi:hypothetical protein